MHTSSRTVTLAPKQTVTVPANLANALWGPYFIDNLPVPTGSVFSSAALLGNINTPQGVALGMVAWKGKATMVQAWIAPASLNPFTAVCGLDGGLVALAKKDENIPSIQLHNSAFTDQNWGLVGTITFDGISGSIQAIGQRDGLIYGFIKSSPWNAFFSVTPADGATPDITYYDAEAAATPFPLPPDTNYIGVPRSVAFYQDDMYAVGESYSNVLCASLRDASVSSFPFPNANTWSLIVDEPLGKAYGGSNVGDITPYAIQDDGSLKQEPNTGPVSGGGGNSSSIDVKLQLLYMAAPFNGVQVLDAKTDQLLSLSRDSARPPLAPGGTWADSDNSLVLIVGVSRQTQQIGIYEVSVSG